MINRYTGSYEQHESEAVKLKSVLTSSIPLLELLMYSICMYLQTCWATIEPNDGYFNSKVPTDNIDYDRIGTTFKLRMEVICFGGSINRSHT